VGSGHKSAAGAAQQPQAAELVVELMEQRHVGLPVRRAVNFGVPPASPALGGIADERAVERSRLRERDPIRPKLEQPERRRERGTGGVGIDR
jgi:hypothetical protein